MAYDRVRSATLLSQSFQQPYNTADTFIAGKFLGTDALAAVCRGAGKAVVPMSIMLSVWCVIRIIYITTVMRLFGEVGYIYWAYPVTWTVSSVI